MLLQTLLFYGNERLLNSLISSGKDRKAIPLLNGGEILWPFSVYIWQVISLRHFQLSAQTHGNLILNSLSLITTLTFVMLCNLELSLGTFIFFFFVFKIVSWVLWNYSHVWNLRKSFQTVHLFLKHTIIFNRLTTRDPTGGRTEYWQQQQHPVSVRNKVWIPLLVSVFSKYYFYLMSQMYIFSSNWHSAKRLGVTWNEEHVRLC